MRYFMPPGLKALPAGSVVRKNAVTGGTTIGGVADNLQPINVASWAGFTSFFIEYQIQILQGANSAFNVEIDYHAPNHNIINNVKYRWQYPAEGAGLLNRMCMSLIAWNNGGGGTFVTGDYHINATTVAVGTGSFTVQRGQIFGVV